MFGECCVGFGVMGFYDFFIYCEIEYGFDKGNELVDKVFEIIVMMVYCVFVEFGKEKGSFLFLVGEIDVEMVFLCEVFINIGFMKKMFEDICENIKENGIWNFYLLIVVLIGSIGIMVGVLMGFEFYFLFLYFWSGCLGKFIEVKVDIV